MNEGDATWSLGILIGVPLFTALILLLIAATVFLFWFYFHDGDGFILFFSWVMVVVTIGTIMLIFAGYYPYKSEYHQYVTKVGTVKSISSRVLGSSDSFQQKFVVQYTDGRTFGCTDTRCALVRKGDLLKLGCKRVWQYNGTDGYDCNWIAFARVA